MGKFGSPQIGRFANGYTEYDDPKLNKCPKCGALTDSRVCPICHAEIPDDMLAGHRKTAAKINVVYCEHCGAENSKGYSKCISCGKKRQKSHKVLFAIVLVLLALESCYIVRINVMAKRLTESINDIYAITSNASSNRLPATNASDTAPETTGQNKFVSPQSPLIYSDAEIEIRFVSASMEDTYIGELACLYISVKNKTDKSMYFEIDSIALNGMSISGLFGDGTVAPMSIGTLEYIKMDADNAEKSVFQSDIETISGEFSYYRNSNIFDSSNIVISGVNIK